MNQQVVNIVLEEYKALRAEVLLCLERRVTIISFGLTAIAVLATAGVTALNYEITSAAVLILAVLVPGTSAYVLALWLAETHRARRASHYLWRIERKLEKALECRSLEWEGLLRQKKGIYALFRVHYYSTVGWFTFVLFVSAWAGLYILVEDLTSWQRTVANASISGLVSFIVSLLVLVWGLSKAKALTEIYNREPEV